MICVSLPGWGNTWMAGEALSWLCQGGHFQRRVAGELVDPVKKIHHHVGRQHAISWGSGQ